MEKKKIYLIDIQQFLTLSSSFSFKTISSPIETLHPPRPSYGPTEPRPLLRSSKKFYFLLNGQRLFREASYTAIARNEIF